MGKDRGAYFACLIGVVLALIAGHLFWDLEFVWPLRTDDHSGPFGPHGSNAAQPALQAGDLFPFISYRGYDGTSGNFSSLLQDTISCLLFVRPECSESAELLSYWQAFIQPQLRSNVQTIICNDETEVSTPNDGDCSLVNCRSVSLNAEHLRVLFGLRDWPVVVWVDRYGLILDLKRETPTEIHRALIRDWVVVPQ